MGAHCETLLFICGLSWIKIYFEFDKLVLDGTTFHTIHIIEGFDSLKDVGEY